MVIPALFQSNEDLDLDPFLMADDLDDQDVLEHRDHGEHEELPPEQESQELSNELVITPPKPSLSDYLAYFSRNWHATFLSSPLAWWLIKHKSDVSTDQEKTAMRLFWLAGEGIPLTAWPKIRNAIRIKNFFDASSFMLSDIGAILLAPILLHDWLSFGLFPEERCGTSFPAIFSGTANNQISWTYHFGSDVIHEAAFWNWLGVILSPPLLGLSSVFLGNKQLHLLDIEQVMPNIERALHYLDNESLTFKDACSSLWPTSRVSTILTQVKCMLLWDGRRDNDQQLLISLHFKKALVSNLVELLESNYFLIRYRAMRLLTQIAASFHPNNLDRFIEDPIHKQGLAELRETILEALRKEPINDTTTQQTLRMPEAACDHDEIENATLLDDPQRGGMARYFRWTLGDDTRPLTQLFWIPTVLFSFYKFYAVIFYLELIVKKLINITYYFHDKSSCENNGNFFKFLTQSERYECIACDWPFVSYQNSFSAQACLENLFQQKMTPSELRHYLSELPAVRGMTQVDLTRYDWSNWPVLDWEKLLLALEPMLIPPLELFNISGSTESINLAPTSQHIQALVQLFTQITLSQFDMSHYHLNDELFPSLLDSLANQPLNGLYLQDTNMTDTSASYLSKLFANSDFNLTDLHLADNQIGDKGIIQINQIVSNSSLQMLNVAQNLLSDLGLQQLGLAIQSSVLHSLDLSGQIFTAHGLSLFNEALKANFSLRRLSLNNVGLTHEHISALQSCLENLEFLDISNNLLGSKAIQSILHTCNQNLKTLISHNNDLGDETGRFLAEELPLSSLEYLDLSSNYLGSGFNDLIRAIPNSQLLSLICENCDLKDADVTELGLIFSNDTLLLQSLNLNKNKISNQTLFNCLEGLPKSSLRELHLNNNEISCSEESALVLAQSLAKTNLTTVDLSNNRLDSHFFNEVAPLLAQSSLQQLSLSGNKLEAGSLKHFSAGLVQLPCHTQDLNAPKLSRQEKRVFYPMKPNTALNRLELIKTDTDNATLRGFCRVSSSLPNVQFLEPDQFQRLDWRNCDWLTTNSNSLHSQQPANQTQSLRSASLIMASPFLISLLCAGGILCVVALLYGSYRASRSTYRFFRPATTTDRTESEENIIRSNLHRSFP